MGIGKQIKFVTWNSCRQNVADNLRCELRNRTHSTLLCVNGTERLQDLSEFGLNGLRHPGEWSRGLCLYVSEHLQHYASVTQGKYSWYGWLRLPDSVDSTGSIITSANIGFICTYRSPSLPSGLNEEYFAEMEKVIDVLRNECELVYILGDLNCYKYRVPKYGSMVVIERQNDATKAYEMFDDSIRGSWHNHYTGPTHFPKQKNIHTAAQLDYIAVVYTGSYPKGSCKTVPGTLSDHDPVVLVVDIPQLRNIKVRYRTEYKFINTNYDLMDSGLLDLASSLSFEPSTIEDDLGYITVYQEWLEECLSNCIKCRKPAAKNGRESHIAVHQNRVLRARRESEEAYNAALADLRAVYSELTERRMRNATRYKCSREFYNWASQIAKPCKVECGKMVMVDKSVKELTDTINANYIAAGLTTRIKQFSWTEVDKEQVSCHLRSFDFEGELRKIVTAPLWFRKCKRSVIDIAKRVIQCIIKSGYYPDSLKRSRADVLPSRTIFQVENPFGKLVEKFFSLPLQIYVDRLKNFAYRQKMSCSSLLLRQFDIFSREDCCVAFNADLVKAFDRLSRINVIKNIDNPLMKEIVRTWMDRKRAPYTIWWRGKLHVIDRSQWNRGVEPGSNLGPLLFIIGLYDPGFYNKSLAKNLYADDGLPIYRTIHSMASDALDFIHFVKSSNMAIHTEGSKAATYMLIGKGTRGFDIKDSTIVLHSNYGDIEISEATTVKQLGINWYVSGKLRKPLIDITCIVSKLKHAATALRGIAPMVKASSALSIVKTYVLSVISTAIVVWFPIVKHNDIGTLNKLRYWYCSVMTYICTDAKDVLGWCNSSKTVREGSSVYM